MADVVVEKDKGERNVGGRDDSWKLPNSRKTSPSKASVVFGSRVIRSVPFMGSGTRKVTASRPNGNSGVNGILKRDPILGVSASKSVAQQLKRMTEVSPGSDVRIRLQIYQYFTVLLFGLCAP